MGWIFSLPIGAILDALLANINIFHFEGGLFMDE
jgi:hypothetical protein